MVSYLTSLKMRKTVMRRKLTNKVLHLM